MNTQQLLALFQRLAALAERYNYQNEAINKRLLSVAQQIAKGLND